MKEPQFETPAVPEHDILVEVAAADHFKEVATHPDIMATMDVASLEEARDQLMTFPEFEAFQKQRITFATFDAILDRAENAPHPDAKIAKNLKIAIDDIKKSVFQYYEIILRVAHLKTQQFRLSEAEYVEEHERRDKMRRQIHNALLANLISFTRFCNVTAVPKLGISIPASYFFKKQELDDRSLIGEWAFNTEFGNRIQEIITSIDDELQKREKAE